MKVIKVQVVWYTIAMMWGQVITLHNVNIHRSAQNKDGSYLGGSYYLWGSPYNGTSKE